MDQAEGAIPLWMLLAGDRADKQDAEMLDSLVANMPHAGKRPSPMGTDLILSSAPIGISLPATAGGPVPLPAGTLTRAADDNELVMLWLRRPNLPPRSVRNCRKEAYRFLFWIGAHGHTLGTVHYKDLLAYAAFIAKPLPADDWISGTRYARTVHDGDLSAARYLLHRRPRRSR